VSFSLEGLRKMLKEELRKAIREELTSGDAAASELVNAILKEIRDRVATEATLSNVLPPLTLIPAYYYDGTPKYGYHAYSGGSFTFFAASVTGGHWYSSTAGNYIEFGFRGRILGIVFTFKSGVVNIYIDGELVETLDVTKIKGPYNNCCYIVKTDLTDEYHIVRVEVVSGTVYVVGVVCDWKRNYYQFFPFPVYSLLALNQLYSSPQRFTWAEYFNSQPWGNVTVPAGGATTAYAIYRYRHLAFYVEVNGPTEIIFEGHDFQNWHTIEVISFTEAGKAFRRYSNLPYYYVRWKTTQEVTITLSFIAKT